MKKFDKHIFAEKALKIKENIKIPQVKLPQGNHPKKEDRQEGAAKEEEPSSNVYRMEAAQSELYQTGAISGNTYQTGTSQRNLGQTGAISGTAYRAGTSQRNLGQTGAISGTAYQTGTSQRNLGQTGMISGNTYRTGTSQRNLYQTGTILENTYRTGTSQRNLSQTGGISGNAYRTGTFQRNLSQTGTISNNFYGMESVQRNPGQAVTASDGLNRMDSVQRNMRQAEAVQEKQGNVRRTKKPQRAAERPAQENVRRTEAMQRNRRRPGTPGENTGQKRTAQRNSRQGSARRKQYQAGRAVKEAQGTILSGAVAAYIKIGLVAVLLLFIALDLSNEPDSAAKIETVAENVVKAAGLESSEPAEARMVKRFYGLNPKDYEGAVLYAPVDNMDAHELFLVKLKDNTQKKTVEDAIEERLDTQLKSFEGYGAEQTALLEKHVLSVKGNYVLYMVGEHAEDAQKAFVKSL